jgi:hypothetical protein
MTPRIGVVWRIPAGIKILKILKQMNLFQILCQIHCTAKEYKIQQTKKKNMIILPKKFQKLYPFIFGFKNCSFMETKQYL